MGKKKKKSIVDAYKGEKKVVYNVRIKNLTEVAKEVLGIKLLPKQIKILKVDKYKFEKFKKLDDDNLLINFIVKKEVSNG